MKKHISVLLFVVLSLASLQSLAYNPAATCNISKDAFKSWFKKNEIEKNGVVSFADSFDFSKSSSTCHFYKWAYRMFLWTASPSGSGIVLDSSTFYDVNFNSKFQAIFLPNSTNKFAIRGAKPQSIQAGGQAGGGDTLLSLNGSLVYFGISVNDVYAWFNTAVSNGVISDKAPFPTTHKELNKILAYAKSKGANLKDGNALTMEFKTAWVDASTVGKKSEYITIKATVPNYKKINKTTWKINAKKPTVNMTLALVGIHVVGPVKGHPEMVWATFEHFRNAPDNDYYTEIPGPFNPAFIKVPYSSAGKWTFMQTNGLRAGALVPQMIVGQGGSCSTDEICATPGNIIQQNNVYRAMPWGNSPTPESANNNSQLISLNNDIRGYLGAVKDIRKNYIQIGAVWTKNGSIPDTANDTKYQAGSKLLANTTMETYHQTDVKGCFGCHFADSSTGTSHLFSKSNVPLVPK